MKINKPIIPARLFIAVGLLLVVSPIIFKDIFTVSFPDFLRGMFMGLGITLEIFGVIIQKKEGKSICKTNRIASEM
jgi:hypothetical protein